MKRLELYAEHLRAEQRCGRARNYDTLNRLVTATDHATDGGAATVQETFLYDTFGNRIEQDVDPDGAGPLGTTVTKFSYQGDEVWADLTINDGLQTRYIHGDVVDQIFARIGTGSQAGAAWYLADHLGSVRDIASATGAGVDHIDYGAFGNVASESAPAQGDRYKYTGREFDGLTGLQYNRARWYDAVVGRWTTADPQSFGAGDANLYRYVGNDPTNRTDRTGLETDDADFEAWKKTWNSEFGWRQPILDEKTIKAWSGKWRSLDIQAYKSAAFAGTWSAIDVNKIMSDVAHFYAKFGILLRWKVTNLPTPGHWEIGGDPPISENWCFAPVFIPHQYSTYFAALS